MRFIASAKIGATPSLRRGAICRQLLAEFGIEVGSHVLEIGGVRSREVPEILRSPSELSSSELRKLNDQADKSPVRCLDPGAEREMMAAIDRAQDRKDTVGGRFEVVAVGLPPGLGSHVQWDRRLDARLAAAVMSIPAIKGVEIGPAFENARRPGTQVHDEFERKSEAAERRGSEWVRRTSNRAGGIEGGMSNGMPVVVRAAMKPIPTTLTPLRSVDLATGKPAWTQYQRSDVCAVPAASIVDDDPGISVDAFHLFGSRRVGEAHPVARQRLRERSEQAAAGVVRAGRSPQAPDEGHV